MSFFGQISHSYNAKDVGQNLSDIQGVLGMLSEETRKVFETKIMGIVSQKPDGLFAVRNMLYEACLYAAEHGKIKGVKGLDKMNPVYQKLLYIYDEISKNPSLRTEFLSKLSAQIDKLLQVEYPGIEQISIETLKDDNFDIQIKFIAENVGHAGIIYLLGECISEGKCLDKVSAYLDKRSKGKVDLSGATLEDLDYFNLSSRLSFRTKLDQGESDAISFSLSGGISNAISQLGYIREHYRNGGRIKSLSGSSMGGIIAVLIAKIIGKKVGNEAVSAIDVMITKLQGAFTQKIETLGRLGKVPFLSVQKSPEILKKDRKSITKSDVEAVQDIFLNFANEYGITNTSRFSELDIPVIINASYQSKDGEGEKEVIISGDVLIIDALFAGANMPRLREQNVGIFGEKQVQGLELVDFAANEEGNPIPLLIKNGIKKSDVIALDVGYSSTNYHTLAAAFSRGFFTRALFRDMMGKADIRGSGGKSVDIDVESSNNSSGSAFSAEIIEKLISIGASAYTQENMSTSPLSR